MRGRLRCLNFLLLLPLAAACVTPRVERRAAETDLGLTWNARDARLIADALIQDSLEQPWLPAARQRLGRAPRVLTGKVANRTLEHIDTAPFLADLQQALVGSQRVEWIAGGGARAAIRRERIDQQFHAAEEEGVGEFGNEAAADLLLRGELSEQLDSSADREGLTYRVVLELIEIGSGRVVWTGTKAIHKVRRR